MNQVPICPYCNCAFVLVDGDVIYPHRQDLKSRKFYLCEPCNAYVGCHAGTDMPFGRLANAELRKAKMDAHTAFDSYWKNAGISRGQAYHWLCKKLGIDFEDCHIGMFNRRISKSFSDI